MNRLRTQTDLAAILSEAGIGVWTWDPSDNKVSWNITAYSIFGVERGDFDGTFEAFSSYIHPDDLSDVTELILSVAERGGNYSTKHRIVQPSGAIRWIEGQGKIVTEDGVPVSGFGVVYDVTDRASIEDERDQLRISERAAKAARTATERDLARLIEVSDGLTGSLNLDRVVERCATFIVPDLADRCVIDVRSDDLDGTTLTVECGSSGKPTYRREPPTAATTARMALPTGTIPKELLAEVLPASPDDDGRLEPASAVALPLVARGTRIGSVVAERHGRPWDARSQSLLAAITRRAAVAVENALLFETQAAVTNLLIRTVQPSRLDASDHFEVATHYRAATEVTRLGGDFYDFIQVSPSSWLAVVGDVAGKGIVAAAQAGLIRSAIRAAAVTTGDPKVIIETVNRLLHADPDRPMATLALAKLSVTADGGRFEITSAGHPPALVVEATGRVSEHNATGALLGFVPDLDLATTGGTLQQGDSLIMYSDGAVDARLGATGFGIDRLAEAAATVAAQGPEAIARAIASAIDSWTAGRIKDDVTVVVVAPT